MKRWERFDTAGLTQGKARRIETPHGTLVFAEPKDSDNTPVVAVFPGFTGDAWTHQNFIQSALSHKLSCLSVTPRWAPSTIEIRKNIEQLARLAREDESLWSRIRFVRAVSYGAYLSFFWLQQLKDSVQQIAWIAPCSNSQISEAAQKMGVTLLNNDSSHVDTSFSGPSIRIINAQSDSIVPTTDKVFETYPHIQRVIAHADHFTAGETPEASQEVAKWFGGLS